MVETWVGAGRDLWDYSACFINGDTDAQRGEGKRLSQGHIASWWQWQTCFIHSQAQQAFSEGLP